MTTTSSLTETLANKIFDILVSHAGADKSIRESFVYSQTQGCMEFRFGGLLGFGGKFWNDHGHFYITGYPEDMNDKRRKIITETNITLTLLVAEHLKH